MHEFKKLVNFFLAEPENNCKHFAFTSYICIYLLGKLSIGEQNQSAI